ncbi:hypothetical protein ZWY2020_028940 [Hordeum vulgare]|nr:hypothetical protein ZWY2020_028940 [Hordeum vulgare]
MAWWRKKFVFLGSGALADVSTHDLSNKIVIYWDLCGGDYLAYSYIGIIKRSKGERRARGSTVRERRMGNKNFPTRTKTYHGDVHLREGMNDTWWLCIDYRRLNFMIVISK